MTRLRFSFSLGLVALLVVPVFLKAAEQNRIVKNVDQSVTFLKDNVHRFARAEFDQGKAVGTLPMQRVSMVFKLSAAQQAELDTLLQQQTDPASPNYHKWLTPAEYGQRFGLSESDLNKVANWLRSKGFTIVEIPPSRTYISFSGNVQQIQSAFRTEIHNYLVNGQPHYANATSPAVPAAFADVVLGFQSLNDFRPKPRVRVNPHFTSSISGNHYLTPDDVATIYNIKPFYNAGYDGTGQKIAVVGQSTILTSDIAAFRAAAGLSSNLPTVILVPSSGTPDSTDINEASLDLEWTGGIAKNATIIYVNSGRDAFDSLQYAIANNVAPVISVSYGSCEVNVTSVGASLMASMAQQAAAQGITIAAASGDSGAADCDYSGGSLTITSATHGLAVDIPASLPTVTGIGGTTFNEGSGTYWDTTNNSSNGSALSYIPEIVWNDTVAVSDLSSGGGGKSIYFSKPTWQIGTGVPDDSARDVPDISFAASPSHDGYLICSQGSCVNGFRQANNNLSVIGGTSAGAPVFAGIIALINQKTGASQGNLNPTLYSLAASTPSAFHDVTSGDNIVPCTAGTQDCSAGGTIGYSATTGYDLASGLGSIDAYALASAWPAIPNFQLSSVSSTLSVTATSSANAVVNVTALNGFSGNITWACSVSSTLTSAASCVVTPDASTPNAKSTLTVTSIRQTSNAIPSSNPRTMFYLALALLPFGTLLIGQKPSKRSPRLLRYALLMLVIVLAIVGATGCGGGGTTSPTPITTPTTVSGTVTVQATSGTLVHTVTFTTTVQ